MNTDSRAFYGWWIVAGGFLLNMAGIGVAINCSSVFFKPVIETYGFSRGDLSLYFTIAALSMMAMAPFMGALLERYDVRPVMAVSTALMSASMASYSLCETLPQFYLVSVFFGIGSAGSHFIPVSMMINNWFVEKRGLAMGIVYAASAAGGVIFSPLTNWLITRYGWRMSYVILGAIVGLITVPVSAFVMRTRPADKGTQAYGGGGAGPPAAAVGLSVGQSVRTGAFWLLGGMFFLLSTVSLGVQQHIIPYMTDVGHGAGFAAGMLALFMGVLIAGKIALGALCDRLGLKRAVVAIYAVYVLTVATLFGARAEWMAVLFAVLFGFSNAAHTVLPPLMTSACLGTKHFAALFGVMNIFITLGSGLGMPLSGYIYDWTASYFPAFGLYIGLIVLSTILGLASLRKSVSPGAGTLPGRA